MSKQILRMLGAFALLALVVNAIGWYRFRQLSDEQKARFMTKGMGRYLRLNAGQKERLRALNVELLQFKNRFPELDRRELRKRRKKWYKAELKAVLKKS